MIQIHTFNHKKLLLYGIPDNVNSDMDPDHFVADPVPGPALWKKPGSISILNKSTQVQIRAMQRLRPLAHFPYANLTILVVEIFFSACKVP